MSLDTVLSRGRAAAEALMRSRATVRRKTGDSTQNETTGVNTPEWEFGPLNLPFRPLPKGNRTVNIGGVQYDEATVVGSVPHDTTDVQDGDHYEITTGEWAGTVLMVLEAVKGDQRTARHLPMVEVQRPTEWGP